MNTKTMQSGTGSVVEEFAQADLGDVRLTRRLRAIAEVARKAPAESFPSIVGDDSALEATYRLLNNPSVTPERILAPHFAGTAERAKAQALVLVAHDTTEFEFRGEVRRAGLERLRGGGQGFFGHFALCLSADGMRRPLGVLGLRTFFRSGRPQRKTRAQVQRQPRKESERWGALVDDVRERLRDDAQAIHLMDREGDAYGLLAHLKARAQRFVIRLAHNRNVQSEGGEKPGKLREVLGLSEDAFKREVPLSSRKKGFRRPHVSRGHRPREARCATLSFRALKVTFPKPAFAGRTWASAEVANAITLNVVHVYERQPPNGVEPIEWMLATTEPISSQTEIEAVVDWYRARWTVEEYFKALKTGCAYERRQLENRAAFLNALALFVPIAVELLSLRTFARHAPGSPARRELSWAQLAALRHLSPRFRAQKTPALQDALLAIAALGGHLKNNGDPGWQVLWRGYAKVQTVAEILQVMTQN